MTVFYGGSVINDLAFFIESDDPDLVRGDVRSNGSRGGGTERVTVMPSAVPMPGGISRTWRWWGPA